MDHSKTYILRNLSVLCGEDLNLIEDAEIVLKNGVITELTDLRNKIPSACTGYPAIDIDLRGYLAIPSFINGSVYIDPYSDKASKIFQGINADKSGTRELADHLKSYLKDQLLISSRSGVTYSNIVVKKYEQNEALLLEESELNNARITENLPSNGQFDVNYSAVNYTSSEEGFEKHKDIPRAQFRLCQTFTRDDLTDQYPVTATGCIFTYPSNLWILLRASFYRHLNKNHHSTHALLEILKSATIYPSKFCNLPTLGRIDVGAKARFQLLSLQKNWDGQLHTLLLHVLSNGNTSRIRHLVFEERDFMEGQKKLSIEASELSEFLGTCDYKSNTNPALYSHKMFDSILDAVKSIQMGNYVVVVDEESRENEGDLIIPAQDVTQENLLFMLKNTSGVICVSMDQQLLNRLDLHPMTPNNTDKFRTAFTISCDYIEGTTSGISLKDRAITITKLADLSTKASDFSRPGHVFPLIPREGGILDRKGHTESSWELCRLANKTRAAALAEIVDSEGNTMGYRECFEFARRHNLIIISTSDLLKYVSTHR